MNLSQRPLLAFLAGLLPFAAAQGPGAACTAGADAACDGGNYCELDGAACAGAGACAFVPDMCTEQYDPVCGCDDRTYSNACKASGQGVNVKSTGECPVPAVTGGGFPLAGACDGDAACEGGKYCSFALGECGSGDGKCDDITAICTTQYDPVCGCDDRTYSNTCDARAEMVSLKSTGECPVPAVTGGGFPLAGACDGDAACDAGKYCSFALEACGSGDGKCDDIPAVCTDDFQPVCGCDDQTYSNACDARAAMVSLKSWSACASAGSAGGGCTAGDATCGEGNFCEAATDGACADSGTCTFVPDMCPMDVAQVCGCDDTTYDNACKARSNGVSVKSQGACVSVVAGGADVARSCDARATCDEGDFCEGALGACDGAGTCAFVPDMCPAVFDEVCGCDDTTYDNACEAHTNGVSVKSQGACDAKTGSDGGVAAAVTGGECTDDAACDGGKYCRFATGTCGSAGSVGACDAAQEMCIEQYQPVCGCDGTTYSNDCKAGTASVSVASDGECIGRAETAPTAPAQGALPARPVTAAQATPTKAPTKPPTAAPTPPPTEADLDDLNVSAGRRAAPRIALGAGLTLALALGCVQ